MGAQTESDNNLSYSEATAIWGYRFEIGSSTSLCGSPGQARDDIISPFLSKICDKQYNT